LTIWDLTMTQSTKKADTIFANIQKIGKALVLLMLIDAILCFFGLMETGNSRIIFQYHAKLFLILAVAQIITSFFITKPEEKTITLSPADKAYIKLLNIAVAAPVLMFLDAAFYFFNIIEMSHAKPTFYALFALSVILLVVLIIKSHRLEKQEIDNQQINQ